MITEVKVGNNSIKVDLSDGRTVSAPLVWYPRLLHRTTKERSNWRIIGKGEGIHWQELDEDISVDNLLNGNPSGESQQSFKKWLEDSVITSCPNSQAVIFCHGCSGRQRSTPVKPGSRCRKVFGNFKSQLSILS